MTGFLSALHFCCRSSAQHPYRAACSRRSKFEASAADPSVLAKPERPGSHDWHKPAEQLCAFWPRTLSSDNAAAHDAAAHVLSEREDEAEKDPEGSRSPERDFLAALGVSSQDVELQMATRLRRSLTEGVSIAVQVRGVPACVGKGDIIALQLLDTGVRCVLKRVAASPWGPSRMQCCPKQGNVK
jgi:hypothetical protein